MGDRSTAIAFSNKAVEALKDGTGDFRAHAYTLFSSACMADPTYGHAFYQAGNNNSDLNLLHAAIACWRRAIECENEPKEKAKMVANLAWRLHSLGRTKEAIRYTNEALEIDQTLALAWVNLSLVEQLRGHSAASVGAARKAYEIAPDDPHTEIALAFALLFDGQYQEGYKHFERRFQWRLRNFTHFPYPKWEGQEGKTLYLVADQGLGDTLSYSRFVERAAAKCTQVHALVQSGLMRLFQHAFSHIPNVNLLPMPSPYPEADYWTTFVSLPYALKLTDADVRTQPHIKAASYSIGTKNWKVPDRKFHIGFSWAGSPLNDIDQHRNIPVQMFYELYQVPGIQLYSLQIGDRAKELQDSGGAAVVRDIAPYVDGVVETLSIVEHLDLVICCESALGHMCALADKECWIPYSYQGRDYRLGLTGEKKLWTPKHRVFCQGEDRNWESVFKKIVEALRERVK